MGQPSPTEKQQIMHECQSFQMYVMQHMQHLPANTADPQGFHALMNALPSGLTCAEAIQGGGESACAIQAKQGKLAVTCEIPEETTITSQCCSGIQGEIDNDLAHPALASAENTPRDVTQNCQSFIEYQRQHMPPSFQPQHVSAIIQSLAAGVGSKDVSD